MAVGEQVARGDADELLSFAPREDGNGLEIVDHIERRHCEIHTSGPISLQRRSNETFAFPVDRTVEIETDEVVIPHRSVVGVRNSLGFLIDELSKGESRAYPIDDYSLELSLHVKIYIRFSDAFSITVGNDAVSFQLESQKTLKIGARSHHKHPAGSIGITKDIEDMMWATSLFGSALKTTSCERSYPTLRGHPPTIEFDEERRNDTKLSRPDTGVSIELPRDISSIFESAPLAFYLGAEILPGSEPRILTDHGYTYPLDTAGDLSRTVERVMKQVFFLDCVTRTEGLFQIDLHERNVIEDKVDLDFAELYELPLSEQLEQYLNVSYEKIIHQVPTWNLSAQIEPCPEYFEAIPFVLNDLAIIKTVGDIGASRADATEDAVNVFLRSKAKENTVRAAERPNLIRVEASDAMEQTWIGEGAPLGASKGNIDSFRNRLDRTPADGDIDITVVCNDSQMAGEGDIVDDIYGSRDELPFNVSVHKEITATELRGVLESDIDFLHYIGHIDAGGFECVDARLDAESLDATGVNAFLLNACTSYQQGMYLIEAGAIAGIVTLQDVINSGAERIGKALARLLNNGFPIRAALTIAETQSIMGGHYLVIGDGSFDVAQSEGGLPAICDIAQSGEDWLLTYTSFLTREQPIGSIIVPFVEENESYYLASGEVDRFRLNRSELVDFLSRENMPVRFNEELIWSDSISERIAQEALR